MTHSAEFIGQNLKKITKTKTKKSKKLNQFFFFEFCVFSKNEIFLTFAKEIGYKISRWRAGDVPSRYLIFLSIFFFFNPIPELKLLGLLSAPLRSEKKFDHFI
jgi:hypothetical protein